ncbi:MAG: hypothetical protein HC813_03815 [Planctomycetes bacterium]|nr:hypothetical protein [Planctomycetota bacterium]
MDSEHVWNRFSYQSALTAVVVGLAITEILGCVANILNKRPRARVYWLHLVWLVLLFMIIVQFWFAAFFWSLRQEKVGNSSLEFSALLCVPVAMYLCASLLAPRIAPDAERFDFREYYYDNHRSIFTVLALTLVVMAVHRTVVSGGAWLRTTNLIRGAGVICLATLACFRHPRLHEAMVFVLIALFATFTALF